MSARAALAVAVADLRQRTRSRSFLVVAALLLWACFASVPPSDSSASLLSFAGARGSYTPSWFGLLFGLTTVILLPLVGFYLVRGAIHRDLDSSVGRILAATQMSRWAYILGKWLSNFTVLVLISGIVSAGAVGMFVWRGTPSQIDLVQLLRPLWSMTLPVLALVAALALLFESLPVLRGGGGNVLYFFVWTLGITLAFASATDSQQNAAPQNDILGISRAVHEAKSRVAAAIPGYSGGFTLSIGPDRGDQQRQVIDWPDASWQASWALERLGWFWPSLLILGCTVLTFGRFDPSRERLRAATSREAPSRRLDPQAQEAEPKTATARALPPATRANGLQLGPLVKAELRLAFRGWSTLWRLAVAGLVLATVILDPITAHANAFPLLWLAPILAWSALGARQEVHRTTSLEATAPRAALRTAIAAWTAGALIALGLALPLALRLLLAGEISRVAMIISGALFVPALALALGKATGGSRTFEALYVPWWYLALQGVPALDFMGGKAPPEGLLRPATFALAAVCLLVLAAVMPRRRQ